MRRLAALSLAVGMLCFPGAALSESIIGMPSIRDLPLSATTTEQLALDAAKRYGIDSARFVATLDCESDHWKDEQSGIPNKKGPNGREDSWGIAQIHLPAHPSITFYEAMDVRWAIDWAASEFAAGRAREWSCYNLLFPKVATI